MKSDSSALDPEIIFGEYQSSTDESAEPSLKLYHSVIFHFLR